MALPGTIIIADSSDSGREYMEDFIRKATDLTLLDTACNGLDLTYKVTLHQPRLVITEVDMPEMDGIEATRQIGQQHPDVYIIGYTMTDEKYGARQMLKAGAHGFLMKNASKAELRYCIEAVHSGSIYICPGCSHLAVRRFSGVEELSDFELLVLQKLVQRKDTPQIAAELFAGETTVKRARSRIIVLAGTSNPYGIFEWALYYGYISMKTIGEGCRG